MTTTLDTRWRQRLDNFDKAYAKLSEAVVMLQEFKGTALAKYDLMCEGLVQRFEFTHELAWNVIRTMRNIRATLRCVAQEMPCAKH